MRFARLALIMLAFPVAAGAMADASLPSALHGSGLWEVGKSANGTGSQRRCLADPAILAQWEHLTDQCTRVVVSTGTSSSEVHYTCTNGGFGTSHIRLLTPRSVRIETQGIAKGYPFGYTLHARRIGNCPAR
ncbi:MAG: hypothetical protein ABI667_03480 [Sphingomicrobium sp.]